MKFLAIIAVVVIAIFAHNFLTSLVEEVDANFVDCQVNRCIEFNDKTYILK